jgi:signal transduction histidine kinase
MSHELRTPLNAIIGFSEVMTLEMFGPVGAPRYLEYARLINESGSHLLELINSILDMSKIEANRFELSQELVDLADITEQAVRFVKFQAERQGIHLVRNIPADARTIYADKRAVTQILVNLLSNGVKFSFAGGVISIAAAARDEGIEISVSDNGVGISEEHLERIGQPFEQVESAMTRTKEGTGLGLALVRSLAQLHGGSMRIVSRFGEGTTVHVILPYAETLGETERAVANA